MKRNLSLCLKSKTSPYTKKTNTPTDDTKAASPIITIEIPASKPLNATGELLAKPNQGL